MFLKNIVVEDEDEDQSEGSYKKMTKEDNNKSKVNKIRNNEEKE